MTAATVVAVPTTLTVCAVVYLAGVYVTFVVAGWMSFRSDSRCSGAEALVAFLWPVTVPVILVFLLCDEASCWMYRHTAAARLVRAAWFWTTLPLRPWRIGRMMQRRQK